MLLYICSMKINLASLLSCFTGLVLGCVVTTVPAVAQSQNEPPPSSKREVLEVCQQNRAETLPNPFTDVPATHWAYRAVLSMYYCEPFRQATPPAMIQRSNHKSTSIPPSNADTATPLSIGQ